MASLGKWPWPELVVEADGVVAHHDGCFLLSTDIVETCNWICSVFAIPITDFRLLRIISLVPTLGQLLPSDFVTVDLGSDRLELRPTDLWALRRYSD